MTCCGLTNRSDGKSFGQVSGASGCALRSALIEATKGLPGCVASEPKYTRVLLSLRTRGLHSIPCPRLHCSGWPPEISTRQRWRRSTSPQLELNRTDLWSGPNDHCSTSQLPGVKSWGAPPLVEREYRCC